MSELKPCPFCGNRADYVSARGGGYRVRCTACRVESGWGDYGYQVLELWNVRSDILVAATAQGTAVDDLSLLDVVAMGLCAKSAIQNGGAGHGRWWELSEETKSAFRELAIVFLEKHSDSALTSRK